ncbi:MAG: glycosyltransferase [Streptosporangiales bacterium]|nr:glycosyltransferase [Streptosporangiales bacterium]
MTTGADVDVLIPTYDRAAALATTLGSVAAQDVPGLRVVISDQSPVPSWKEPLAAAALRIVEHRGGTVRTAHRPDRRGPAEQRAYLLSRAERRYVLFLDDDVWLEPCAVRLLRSAIAWLGCGFVGYAVQGLSYLGDERPDEQLPYEEWREPVRPERVRRGGDRWRRHHLHNAANLVHLARRHPAPPSGWRPYKVAWIGGCVLFDRAALLAAGGFDFWPDVPPEHAGEDQVAQLRVLERCGGAGLLPSRAVHLELPTTVPRRGTECYDIVFGPDVSD